MRRLAVLAAVLALPAAAAAQPIAIDVERGKEVYAATCLSCHGPDGRGVPQPHQGAFDVKAEGPPLKDVGAMGADFYVRTGYMPLDQAGQQPERRASPLTPEQIDAVIAYVASLGNGPPVPHPHPERGNLAAGMRLFTNHCAGCHQAVAAGGYLTGARVPPLNRATPTQIAEAVRLGPYLMPSFSPRRLSDAQLDSIIRYVLYAKHPDDRGGWALGHVGPVPEGLVTWWIGMTALVACCVFFGRRLRR